MEFEFVAGDPALDFVATVAEWTTSHVERLTWPDDLADWLVSAGVLDVKPKVDQADLVAARALRQSLYDFLVALTDEKPPSRRARAVINRCAAGGQPVLSLSAAGRPVRRGTAASGLAELARHGIALAGEDRRPYIAWCDDATCTRAFLDRSRGRRRRWCGMAGCGDRAKAAAYRHRRSR